MELTVYRWRIKCGYFLKNVKSMSSKKGTDMSLICLFENIILLFFFCNGKECHQIFLDPGFTS